MKGNCGECGRRWFCEIDPDKCNEWPDPVPQTNADHIRAMTDEELAKFIVDSQFNLLARGCEIMGCSCPVTREDLYGDIPQQLEWLRQPYKENT